MSNATASFLAATLCVLGVTQAGAACRDSSAIWATETDGVRHVIYGTDGVNYGSLIVLEEWRRGKLAWRGGGDVTCSNGASICYAMMVNAGGFPKGSDEAKTDVVVEQIDENGDGLSEWIILAALGQSLYYSGGLKVEWFNGFEPSEFERITAPNLYKFFACRDGA